MIRLVICLVALLAAPPLAAQEMTKAEEAAYTALWQMSNEALARRGAGDMAGAETLFADVLALVERDLPGEVLTRAAALHNLAGVRADLGRLAEAEAMAREALSIRRAEGGETGAITSTERLLSSILHDLERTEEARAFLDSVVTATLEDPDSDRSRLIEDFAGLAVLTAEAGDTAMAMALLGQLEPLLPDLTAPDAARSFVALGRVQSLAGEPVLAEAAYRESAARSATIPADEPRWTVQDRVNVIGNLASMLLAQGREIEAEPLFRQALAMGDAGGVAPLVRANLLDGLGMALAAGGHLQAAYDAQRAGLDLRLAALPPNHAQLGASFGLTGETILRAGEPGIARDALTKALAIADANGDALRAGRAALMLAAAEAASGIPAFDRARAAEAVLAGLLPAGRPELAGTRFIAASIALHEGRAGEALPLAEAALADIVPRLQRAGADATVASAGAGDLRQMVLPVLSALWAVDPEGGIDTAFQAAQWATVTRASRATQRMAARTAAASGDLATLARGKQDLVNRWQEADRTYVAALGKGGGQAEGAVLAALEGEIAATDAALAAQFPEYAALVTPEALSVAEVQARLTPGEALVMIVPAPAETFVFAVTPDAARWHRADLGAAALDEAVRHLRAALDPTGPARAAVALDAPEPQGQSFDRGAAFALHGALLAPLADMLGARVLVVADGAMASLPLAVLVATPPQGDDADPVALAATDWMARHHAFATLPSVQALAGLRDRGAPEVRPGFLGFGAPDFAGGSVADVATLYDGARGRAEAVRALPPLPGTRRELLGLARQMGAGEGALRLGAEATEAAVKAADFAGAGVVAFATHGLIAGDIRGLAEPALAFTPPDAPDDADDGLLTASEAGQLRLAADWVILSACNTAAPDGTPGAEGLSGLAAAFLYAGARGLLVSHWPVGDAAAERLTQGAVARLAADPALGQAGALAAAMEDLRADPAFAHPSAWAPFVVVGDGR